MFAALVLKELRDHLLSLRFQAGFLLALVLVSASAFVLSDGYRRKSAEHFLQAQQEDEFVRKYSHPNRIFGVLSARRPPSPLVPVRGVPDAAGSEALDGEPVLEMFPPMDLPMIVAVLFSLFGIVLGFDAVNGERESGTLRLMLANSLRRFDVLAAKWAGGMLVLVAAFLAAVLACAGIVLARSGAHWTADDWLSFAAVCAVSLAYCGAFFSLALLFSTLARRSSVSVLTSVFAWVVLVLVIPNVSPYVAARFEPLPSVAALQRDLQYITSEERDEVGSALVRKVREKYNFHDEMGDVASAETRRRVAADPEYRRIYEQVRNEIQAAWDEANRRQRAKAQRLWEDARARFDRQFLLSRRISCASPLPPLVYASTELALAGFKTREQFQQQTRAYGEALGRYIWGRFQEEQRRNPALGVNDFLDISTRPKFVYAPPPFSWRLDAALPYFWMLAAWNAVLFLGAAVGFLRFDVR